KHSRQVLQNARGLLGNSTFHKLSGLRIDRDLAGYEDKAVGFYCLRIRPDRGRRAVSLDWLSHWSNYPQNKGGILTEATKKHKRHKKHKNVFKRRPGGAPHPGRRERL